MFIRALADTQKAVILKFNQPKSIHGDVKSQFFSNKLLFKGNAMCCGAELFASLVKKVQVHSC